MNGFGTSASRSCFTQVLRLSSSPVPMAPSINFGRDEGGNDGRDHSSFESSSSMTHTNGPVPTDAWPPASELSSSSGRSNTGAIVGGVVGAVAALALLSGFVLWWWKRRRTDKRNARVWKEKLDLDSDGDHNIDVDAIPIPATHLALPPEKRAAETDGSPPLSPQTDSTPSDSRINQNLTSSPQEVPRLWQVHNTSASSPSLQLQNAIVISGPGSEKEKKALSIPSSGSSLSRATTSVGTLAFSHHGHTTEDGHSNSFAKLLSSPTTTSAGTLTFSHHGHTTEDSHGNTSTPPTSVQEDESELAHLRRRVTLLTQENARLSAATQNILGMPSPGEAPPAYDNRALEQAQTHGQGQSPSQNHQGQTPERIQEDVETR
ncbi:hypothetical protein D9758_005174 [Tetrapyrgos nigripes]|uniref:Uncharacterized protein n=1 Tax=Tetrapyrgos nigripes TaxID=182062 RepID=A0A8H5GWS2_9AGAR|nr:hypothetical protein D9758_005174 [Tetrapyrgos nigripes]